MKPIHFGSLDSCSQSYMSCQLALSSIGCMSVSDLERAATAPCRWIAVSKNRNRDGQLLRSRTTRGLGLHLVACGQDSLTVWDLGYVLEPTEIWGTTLKSFLVHPTPDALGIRIPTYSYVDNVYPTVLGLSDDTMCFRDISPKKISFMLQRLSSNFSKSESELLFMWK